MTAKTKTKTKKLTTQTQARQAMADFIKFKEQKAKIEAKQKSAKLYLEEFANEYREKFDDQGNLKLPGGYLHWGKKTEPETCDTFDLGKFMEQYPGLVDTKLKTAAVKAMMNDPKGLEALQTGFCIDLKEKDELSIVVK